MFNISNYFKNISLEQLYEIVVLDSHPEEQNKKEQKPYFSKLYDNNIYLYVNKTTGNYKKRGLVMYQCDETGVNPRNRTIIFDFLPAAKGSNGILFHTQDNNIVKIPLDRFLPESTRKQKTSFLKEVIINLLLYKITSELKDKVEEWCIPEIICIGKSTFSFNTRNDNEVAKDIERLFTVQQRLTHSLQGLIKVDEKILVDIYIQICYQIYNLQLYTSFLHKDLHFGNIMFQEREEEKTMTYTIGDTSVTINSKFKVYLIDFGQSSFIINSQDFPKSLENKNLILGETCSYNWNECVYENKSHDLRMFFGYIRDYYSSEMGISSYNFFKNLYRNYKGSVLDNNSYWHDMILETEPDFFPENLFKKFVRLKKFLIEIPNPDPYFLRKQEERLKRRLPLESEEPNKRKSMCDKVGGCNLMFSFYTRNISKKNSAKRNSPKRNSPKRNSPKRNSRRRNSPKRSSRTNSTKRNSRRRNSTKRNSRRNSPKRNSTKRNSRRNSTKRSSRRTNSTKRNSRRRNSTKMNSLKRNSPRRSSRRRNSTKMNSRRRK